MKKFFLGLVGILLFLFALVTTLKTSAQKAEPEAVSPHLVISQFQTGGDGPGTFNDEFIEIHNIGANPVDLNGYRLVYRSTAGVNDVAFANWTTSVVIPAGGYYLIASSSYNGSTPANITYDPNSCQCSMGGGGGGLAIRNGPLNTGAIIDSVGWGSATNIFVEGTRTAAPNANNSQSRLLLGCQDTDNNVNDFAATVPSAPRNASASVNVCSGGGTTLFAAMNANPSTLYPGGTTLLTVSVIPATTPPSTAITVSGNLTNIGGASNQPFFDNGTHGDVTAGDNVFSFQAVIPSVMGGGQFGVSAVASDIQGRTANTATTITINGCPVNDLPLALGNPSNATSDIVNENNYLMVKPQYSLSYNRSKATANWVAWRLDSSWIGDADRQDDFRPDTSLPAGWYQVLDSDYVGTGYQRGHMTPSGDRTCSIPDNSATFLMTNIIPQYGPNNEGPWADLENYCRTLASQGKEMYIISGVHGNFGTIASGQIVVPNVTWKVVMVLENGANDLQRVNRATRAFGVIMPNHAPVSQGHPWRQYRVTVNAVEYLTGHDFFSNIPRGTQELIERQRDRL